MSSMCEVVRLEGRGEAFLLFNQSTEEVGRLCRIYRYPSVEGVRAKIVSIIFVHSWRVLVRSEFQGTVPGKCSPCAQPCEHNG